ncbi:NAD(P)/FAD-dependent oxidoreductase [Streptomyces sp. NBC_01239]|uniref:flavin-containing monooxygenase n=1 Tax=Streptomyces sp. NBC_01239 TaxID=2903792 RepID=UPI00225A70F0|nr:NAD(P)/FAD-dependent oxidoreductase [Streptomyces sp. NBC_01239]MCX4815207.1 NAD(P)/FAD-dependent oxidoreductase [Streptomyces sp. NBC_01239]
MTEEGRLATEATGSVDEEFMDRALDDADLNALRLALYQATGDESLLELPLRTVPMYGGALDQTVVADEAVAPLRARVKEFLRNRPADFTEVKPADAELRGMYEAFRNEKLTDRDWAYRRDLAAFDDHPRLAEWTGARPAVPEGFQVAVIGAGFGGIAVAVQLEHLGIPYRVYERRPELGGTWSSNAYPDVRVDTTNFLYQFFFEKNYPWTEYFARAGEVREYLEHVAKKYGVHEHISFGSDVKEAVFDAGSGRWELDVETDGRRQTLSANAVVSASGLFATPKHLDVPGIEDFRGEIVHTAECTGQERIDGRDVAIIGNGSTGVQMMSEVRSRARSVGVFQRTPQWISPRERYGELISPETRWLLDTMPYYWNWYCYSIATLRLGGQVLQEPDPKWQAAGGLVNEANDGYRESLTQYVKSKLGDRPDLWDKLIPQHAPMARRLIVDNNWYASLLEDNVELVTESIERFTPTGIRTADGKERSYDLVFTATGFATQKYLWPTRYRGLDGATLEERWSDPEGGGPRAYLSITVPDFPNLFIMYGPNSQNRSGSLIVWMETWARYTAEGLVALIEGGHRHLTVREEVFEEYNRRLDEAMLSLIWYDAGSKDRNYYVNEFGRQQVNVPWRLEEYHRLLERFDPGDYHFA